MQILQRQLDNIGFKDGMHISSAVNKSSLPGTEVLSFISARSPEYVFVVLVLSNI